MGQFSNLLSSKTAGYVPLPENVTPEELEKRDRMQADRHRRAVRFTLGAFVLFALGSTLAYAVSRSSHTGHKSCETWKKGYRCAPEISRLWGQYSPFWPVESDISPAVPKGCEVTFAQVLSRHGARDPTLGKSIAYGALIARIHSDVTEYGADVAFIRDYEYKLGADELTAFGEQQLVNSGTSFYHRYQYLARKSTPFVRTAGQHRVVESARKWALGFHQSRKADKHAKSDDYPYGILIIPESAPNNNTLSPDTCPAWEEGGSALGHDAQDEFAEIFTPAITQRLNGNLPGANLSSSETIYLMDLCPFETVADKFGRPSQFCDLFSHDEWAAYDYYQTLGKWYGYSSGNTMAPTQGVGFANELIARLTRKPVKDHTTTNSTLDSSPKTFPLDRKMYADFSHDNDMAAIFGALGLYNATKSLDWDMRQDPWDESTANGFAASWTVPFAARMYVEKMTCKSKGSSGNTNRASRHNDDDDDDDYDSDDDDYDEDDKKHDELVRVLVNDRVVPLQNCGADELGRCELGRFVQSLSFARGGGHWGLCYA